MDQTAIDLLERQIDEEVSKRFPGAVQRVAVLQYGDDPVIEPGGLLVRVILAAGEGREAQHQALKAFENAHGPAIKQFRKDLSAQLPEAGQLEFRTSGDDDGPRMVLGGRTRGSLEARAESGEGGSGTMTQSAARSTWASACITSVLVYRASDAREVTPVWGAPR